MYQEPLAEQIADHFRSHIEAYLEATNNAFAASERSTVRAPKTIETASLAGGVFSVEPEKLPAFAIDVNNKTTAPVTEDVYAYQYEMQIAGVVTAQSQKEANRLVKRYEAGTEQFFKQHWMLHLFEPANFDFSVLRLVFQSANFSGAEAVTIGQDTVWIAGFTVAGLIITSEGGPVQHS